MAGRKSVGPWWNADKGRWFVWHDGRKVNLKTDDEREAVRSWHRLMGGVEEQPVAVPEKPKANPPKVCSVRKLVDAFLADADGRMTPACRRNYVLFLQPFTDRHGDAPAEGVTPADVDAVSRNPNWSTTYRSGFVGCVLTLFRWGMRAKLIATNPVGEMRKPPKATRGAEAVVAEADHKRLVAHADPLFADFLTLLWLTGARPGELTGITGDMVRRMADGVIVLKEHKTAHKGKGRLLILTPDAAAVLTRRAEGVEGRLFPFTRKGVTARMIRLRKRAGVGGVIAYGYRHTFATDALSNGVPDATVAALLGHCDTSMVHRHYSHLSSRTRALRDAVGRVRG